MSRIIYKYDDYLGYHNAFIQTKDKKWKSIGEKEILAFLKEAKEKDIEITIDGCVPYLSAIK